MTRGPFPGLLRLRCVHGFKARRTQHPEGLPGEGAAAINAPDETGAPGREDTLPFSSGGRHGPEVGTVGAAEFERRQGGRFERMGGVHVVRK